MHINKITDWFYQYNKDVYHFLVYYTGSEDVEDMVQEVYIRAIKGFDSFQGKSSPKTWLLGIARHVGIDEVRRKKRVRILHVDYFYKENELKDENSPERILQLNEEHKQLYRIIKSLKSNYKDVIILRGIKELTVAETASVLNWNENKVRITYHRALKILQKKKRRLSE
ncbi:RNA polymerase sigma factor [Paraliobacillus ryukyuensis]|uniref:RNA polymerase sigma factor n=1 Tax=Paraliobacillus ryukyuensis TaxID=200904 RepID=UPI0009A7397C|nr:RNA polymerase sigma factor [Paraliobacillus ryukyuensis]